MILQKFTHKDYLTSQWSGGTTTQLMIYPHDAHYNERNFLFRASSATVCMEHSIFTSLPGITRFITPLNGSLKLIHRDHHTVILNALATECFQGDWETESYGKVTDFNLMIASTTTGKMSTFSLKKDKHTLYIESDKHYFAYIVSGNIRISDFEQEYIIKTKESIYIKTEINKHITFHSEGIGTVIWCEIAQ